MRNKPNYKLQQNEEKVKVGWHDLLAIMIAQFQILFPLAVGFVVVIGLLLLFFVKVWLRQ
jgi:hypothetical protein